MTYSKQTWQDSNPSYPVSAVRMQHLEDGIAAAVGDGDIVFDASKLGSFGLTSVVADGTTNAGPAINALLRYCEAQFASGTGVKIQLPRGSIAIDSSTPIIMPYFSDKMIQVELFGSGRNGTKLVGTGSGLAEAIINYQIPRDSGTNAIVSSAGAAHTLHDLRIEINQKAKFGVKLENQHACRIYNFFARGAATQVQAGERTAEIKIAHFDGTYLLSWEHHIGPNVRLEGGSGSDPTTWSTYGLWMNSSDNHIDGVVSIRHDTSANDGADFCEEGGNNFYSNCHTFFSEVGYYVKGSTHPAKFVNCEADTPLLRGWRIQSSYTQILGCNVFWLNTMPGGGSAIDVPWDCDYLNIVGNTFSDGSGTFDTANAITGLTHILSNSVVTANSGTTFNTGSFQASGAKILASRVNGVEASTIGGNAVDLQFIRSGNTDIASGAASFSVGGRNQTAGSYAVTIGNQNLASGDYSISTGNRGVANGGRGKRSHAAGRFAVSGDQQISDIVLARSTTSTSIVRLNSNASTSNAGGSFPMLPSAAGATLFRVNMIGFDTSNNDTVAWKTEFLVVKTGAALSTVAQVGSATWSTIASSGAGASATPGVVVDTTLGLVSVSVTPPNANAWHWVARLDAVEVG